MGSPGARQNRGEANPGRLTPAPCPALPCPARVKVSKCGKNLHAPANYCQAQILTCYLTECKLLKLCLGRFSLKHWWGHLPFAQLFIFEHYLLKVRKYWFENCPWEILKAFGCRTPIIGKILRWSPIQCDSRYIPPLSSAVCGQIRSDDKFHLFAVFWKLRGWKNFCFDAVASHLSKNTVDTLVGLFFWDLSIKNKENFKKKHHIFQFGQLYILLFVKMHLSKNWVDPLAGLLFWDLSIKSRMQKIFFGKKIIPASEEGSAPIL